MPINALIPLQAKGPDPEGFTNALLSGMKMGAFRTQADAAAAKAASDSAYNTARAGKVNTETLGAQFELISKHLDAARSNPTRENITATLASLEANGIPTADFQRKVDSTPDQGLPGLIQARALSFEKEQELGMKREGLDIQQRNTDSQIAYRESMLGKPMVVQTPGAGLVSVDPHNPGAGATPVPGAGPSSSEVAATAAEAAAERQQAAAEQRVLGQQTAAQNRQGVANSQKLRDFEANMKQLTDATDSLDADLVKHGTETDFGVYASPEASVQSTRYADVMAAIQRIRDMGVLQPGEFPFLEMAVNNPTRLANMLRGPNIRAQLAELKAQAGRALERAKTRFTVPAAGPQEAPAGPAPTMEPGADPGFDRTAVEAEMRKRGLLLQ